MICIKTCSTCHLDVLHTCTVSEFLVLYCCFIRPSLSDRTAVGIRGKDGVVFGVEKLITSKLYETGDNKRILNVDRHVGAVSI